MLTSRTITIEGVGDVLFERSRRAKHINISLRPFRGVRVAVPCGISYARAEAVVQSKTRWIQTHLERMKAIEREGARLRASPPIDRAKARRQLVKRLNELAERYGFTYNRVFIRNQRTRWGSCSARNNINLNINLVRLPEALSDYIILHELVHTRWKHHGWQFWDELNRLVPDGDLLQQQLKSYKALLI